MRAAVERDDPVLEGTKIPLERDELSFERSLS